MTAASPVIEAAQNYDPALESSQWQGAEVKRANNAPVAEDAEVIEDAHVRNRGPQREYGMMDGKTLVVEEELQCVHSEEKGNPAADNDNAAASPRMEINRQVAEFGGV
jgi:hypothetical protein